jgi:hypothetical protein
LTQALAEPVGVVLPATLLNGTVLGYLAAHAPRLTAGVIVLEDEPGPEEDARLAAGAFSPDVTTPQGQGTPSAALTIGPAHPWNVYGNGIALQDYPFPVVLATGKQGKGSTLEAHGVFGYYAHPVPLFDYLASFLPDPSTQAPAPPM